MKSEFEFIEKIRRQAGKTSAKMGIGDDCAIVPANAKTDYVISTDMMVEDIDFRLKWTEAKLLGHKLLAVSLSDIASTGARPLWAMLSIAVPTKIWKTKFVGEFYSGWFALAKKYGVSLIGGDTSRSPDKIVIDSIVIGEVKKNRAILRSQAKPGDLIYVSGELGGAGYGLQLLENGDRLALKNPRMVSLIKRHAAPNPRVELGMAIAAKDLATSMIDISDGLSSDLAHICRESSVGARLDAASIPIDRNLLRLEPDRSKALVTALNGGEDFELLFTVNPKKKSLVEKLAQKHGIIHIGQVTASIGKIELNSNGKLYLSRPSGFTHF